MYDADPSEPLSFFQTAGKSFDPWGTGDDKADKYKASTARRSLNGDTLAQLHLETNDADTVLMV